MRSIRCRCLACGAAIKVSEEFLGRKAKCPKCSAPIEIPTASQAEKFLVDEGPETRPSDEGKQEPSGAGQKEAASGAVSQSDEAREPAAEEPAGDFLPVVIDTSESEQGPRTAAAARMRRTGDRTLRLALLISAASVVLLIAAIGAFSFLTSSKDTAANAPARPAPSPSRQSPPATPAPSGPSRSTLVLDWPESERPGSVVRIDGSQRPVPSSGPVKFEVTPGEHRIGVVRRGYAPIDLPMDFEAGGHHHYRLEWKEVELAKSEPAVSEPAEPRLAKPETQEAKLAVDAPGKPRPKPEEPMPKPEAASSFDHPEELLASKGLGAHGDYWSLPEESELSKNLRAAQKTWGEILEAQRAVTKAQEVVDDGEAAMLAYVQKLGELGVFLRTARTVEENNRIVGAMNELEARMVIAKRQLEEVEKARDQASGTSISKTSEFEGQLLEFRDVYDKVKRGYEALAADPAVAEAIRRVNEADSKKTRLGPGTMFVSIGKRLEGLEAKVFSESIPLRRGDGNLWYVPVVFNGKSTQEMAIDTGASVIALGWETALSLGLAPPADSRTVYAQVADGNIVPCKQVFAETVRVGKFTVENVECSVMPASVRQSTPLLGLSFFKNFSFQIDSGNGRLIMSQVDTSDTGERSPADRRSRPAAREKSTNAKR